MEMHSPIPTHIILTAILRVNMGSLHLSICSECELPRTSLLTRFNRVLLRCHCLLCLMPSSAMDVQCHTKSASSLHFNTSKSSPSALPHHSNPNKSSLCNAQLTSPARQYRKAAIQTDRQTDRPSNWRDVCCVASR